MPHALLPRRALCRALPQQMLSCVPRGRQMASQGLDAFSQSGLYSNHMARPVSAPRLSVVLCWGRADALR